MGQSLPEVPLHKTQLYLNKTDNKEKKWCKSVWISLIFTKKEAVWNSEACLSHLPEAGFRRHAPLHTEKWWRWRGGVLWLLRIVDSSLVTYISLTGQNSTSALLRASSRHRPTAANLPLQSVNRKAPRQAWRSLLPCLTLLLTLTAFIAASSCPFRAEPLEDGRQSSALLRTT